jgi:DNA-binding CsgD family transcriptional regulator
MLREQQVLDLVGHMYDAALDASRWPTVLQDLVRLTHSRTGNLAEINIATGATRPLAAVDMPIKGFADYEAYYWQKDIWTPKPGTFEIGVAYSSQRTIADRVLLQSEFYHDWMKPLRLFYGMGGIPLVEGNRMLLIGLHRPKLQGKPFNDRSVQTLQQLFPHIKRALQMHHRLEQTAIEREALAETTDHLPRGICTFNARGQLLWVNRTGEEICRQADGLTIQRGILTASVAGETQQLQQLLRSTTQVTNGTGTTTRDAMLISRPSGRRPFIVLVSPLRAGHSWLDDRQPTAVVFVSDLERTPELPADRLARLYGLTPAEAQLAQHVASGKDLQEIAATSRRTMNTVRTQLKQVFHKTGTRRQAQLVRLVLQTEGMANGHSRAT